MRELANYVGRRGESIAMAELLMPEPTGVPFFNPHFLGDKTETLDLYVELVAPSPGKFFLAQIKTTTNKLVLGEEQRLPIRISGSDYRNLAGYRVPIYLLGVYTAPLTPEVYLLGIDRTRNQGLSYFPTAFPLTPTTLEVLHREVDAHWQQAISPAQSRFIP